MTVTKTYCDLCQKEITDADECGQKKVYHISAMPLWNGGQKELPFSDVCIPCLAHLIHEAGAIVRKAKGE